MTDMVEENLSGAGQLAIRCSGCILHSQCLLRHAGISRTVAAPYSPNELAQTAVPALSFCPVRPFSKKRTLHE
jgi:hypothetical protein